MFKKKILVVLIYLQNIKSQTTYRAAVLEYAPTKEDTAENTMLKNLNAYRTYTEQAAKQSVNIIVFPEYGLTSLVSEPAEYAIVIPDNDTTFENRILEEIHALALEHNIYLVVNLIEKVNSSKQINYYNTNLVFNRQGKIISKYRKINLYDEDNFTPGTDLVSFTTDFGVTFGVFTCFDILFKKPAKDVLLLDGVTDIIFPTAWFSATPFYVSLSVQHSYSVANSVNLLAADYNRPSYGNGGSGIYLGNGKIAESYINGNSSSKLIIQDVYKINKRVTKKDCSGLIDTFVPPEAVFSDSDLSNFVTRESFEYKKYNFANIDLTKSEILQKICQNSFCCTFNISIASANTNEFYKIMAFDGHTKTNDIDRHIRVCSLLACASDDASSCSKKINTTTNFAKITVTGSLPSNNNESFYQPTTLTSKLLPITDVIYCSNSVNNDNEINITFSTINPKSQVLAFGIFGGTSSADLAEFNVMIGVILMVITLLMF